MTYPVLPDEWDQPFVPFRVAGVRIAKLPKQDLFLQTDPPRISEKHGYGRHSETEIALEKKCASENRDVCSQVAWVPYDRVGFGLL